MKKHKILDEFHYHEALDRAYIVESILNTHLAEHPVIQQHKDLKDKIEKAQELIIEVYQEIGSLGIRLFDPKFMNNVKKGN